jgi:hypothetical protein
MVKKRIGLSTVLHQPVPHPADMLAAQDGTELLEPSGGSSAESRVRAEPSEAS